ncbi:MULTISPECIES: peptidoglycan-binding protein [unclassified Sinorhizobium]|uniref:peptidoglycan-binding protein n=1 Tax=unclassified Sinorhizobium TaxID=2613772 RepID=UPI003524E8F5
MHRRLVLAALLPTCIVASCTKANDDLEVSMARPVSAGLQQVMPKQADAAQRQNSPKAGEEEDAALRAYRAEIQKRLNALGFDAGDPDGMFDSRSRQAIAAYQRSIGQAATGKITVAQIVTLYERTNGRDGAAPASPKVNSSESRTPLAGTVLNAAASARDGAAAATDAKVTGTIGLPTNEVAAIATEQSAEGTIGRQELPAEQAEAGAQSAAATGSQANAVMNTTIREAVCRNDESALQSVETVIDAGILDKNAAIAAVDASIRMCMTAGETPRKFLLSLAGKDISIPYWMDLPGYLHGDPKDLPFGHVPLKPTSSIRFLVTGTYPQMVMMMSFGTSDQTYFRDDSAFASLAPAAINKRDCLGFTPLFYASNMGNFGFLKWLLDNGADPNMPVPFVTDGPGLVAGGASQSGLPTEYGCVDNGPNAALMESYKTNNELVPVWTYALRQINAASGKANFRIMAEMLARVSSVPATTLADVIDSKSWNIDINAEEDVAMIKMLAEKGADLNAPLRDGRRPMASWIQQGINPESLRQLMFIGARL